MNALTGAHARWVYETLLRCVADTLTQFAADPRWLGGIGGFTLVLHTWTQDLRRHVHAHALMACGALGRDPDGTACWVQPKRPRRFLGMRYADLPKFVGRVDPGLLQALSARHAQVARRASDGVDVLMPALRLHPPA